MNPYDVDPLKKAAYYFDDIVLIKRYDCYLIGKVIDIIDKDKKISYKVEIRIIDSLFIDHMVKIGNLCIDEKDIIRKISLSELSFDECRYINTYNKFLDTEYKFEGLYDGVLTEPEKNIDTKFKKNEIVYEKESYNTCIILETSFVNTYKGSFDRVYLIKNKDLNSIYFKQEDWLIKVNPTVYTVSNKSSNELVDHSPVEVVLEDDNTKNNFFKFNAGDTNTKDNSFKFNIGDTVKFKQYEMIDGYILDTIYLKVEDRFTIKEKKYYALTVIDYSCTNECGIIIRTEDKLELITDKIDDYSVHGYDTRRLLWKIKKFEE